MRLNEIRTSQARSVHDGVFVERVRIRTTAPIIDPAMKGRKVVIAINNFIVNDVIVRTVSEEDVEAELQIVGTVSVFSDCRTQAISELKKSSVQVFGPWVSGLCWNSEIEVEDAF